MNRVFVSYSRRNSAVVDRISEMMKDASLDVWIDREEITAGNTWRVQIVQAIDTCDAFLLMLSADSAASDNVRREIDLALDSKRPIFVFMLEPVTLPAAIRYQLAGLQHIDGTTLGFETAASKLIQALKIHMESLKPSTEPAARVVELVIKGISPSVFDEAKRARLLEFISKLSNVDAAQLRIADVTMGSLHVFVEMPSESAFVMKTLALNREARFKESGIVSLRIRGDAQFINIAFGIFTSVATISLLNAWLLYLRSFFLSLSGVGAGKTQIGLLVLIIGGCCLLGSIIFILLLISRALLPAANPPTEFPPATTVQQIAPTFTRLPIFTPIAILPSPSPEIPPFHTEDFENNLDKWPHFIKNGRNNTIIEGPVDKVYLDTLEGVLSIDIQTGWRRVYAIYEPFEYRDVRLDARVINLGNRDNYFSLICRYSGEGWYEFNIVSGGLYDIKFAKPGDGGHINYSILAEGGSNEIKQGAEANEFTFICREDTLVLFINSVLTKEIRDARLDSGKIGISVAAFENFPVRMDIDWVRISPP